MFHETLLILLLGLAPALSIEHAAPAGIANHQAAWPCRLGVPRRLAPAIGELWRSSPTFRRQCLRVAEAEVVVAIGIAPVRVRQARALSHIYRRGGRVFHVSMVLRDDRFVSEDVPHELEHVLEQIEGRDLEAEVLAGRATFLPAINAYETDRARQAGQRARSEVLDASRAGTPSTVIAQSLDEEVRNRK